MSLQHRINIQLLKEKEIVNALNNVDELEKFKKLEEIYKELVTRKEEIEGPNSRWKNANKYKEPNNPDLQTRINQILENGPNAKEESINENINTIINYLKVEEKIYNAEKNAGYIIAGTPFYMSTYSDITKLISVASTAIKDEDESRKIKKLRNIEKSILEIRNRIEENNSGIWKNANKYKEPNNPDLQTRINQILENGPIRQQNFIDAANQEHIPNNSNGSNSFHNVI
ncbi:hypothetical protein [Spiroplasma endosymbiont of Amphimallon solstitiale]|uniref:hypothetical protein n=1 Tax=Spiroplasma endosymbiont of Amphimallon solstitiale TaxID=3066288 RepID=UPI00313B8297